MSLKDEAKALTPRKGPGCGIGKFLAHLSDEMRAEVIDALNDPECTDTGLVAALEGRGYDVPRVQTWGNHRRGRCLCNG